MAYVAIAGFFIVLVVGGVGFGVASASSVDDVAGAGAFGFSPATHKATSAPRASVASVDVSNEPVFLERSALATSSPRDISVGMQMVDEMERAEQLRKELDDKDALKRMAQAKTAQGVYVPDEQVSGVPPAEGSMEYGLPAVDWSVGHDAFVAEWAARIDSYLEGSPLEGYGSVFAQAAWENGVDPRWSPAISNTESSKGAVCFRSCNAWGWGDSGWDDWETAIRSHVSGLANGYGYSITEIAAQIYCPPNWANWYSDTLNQMACI